MDTPPLTCWQRRRLQQQVRSTHRVVRSREPADGQPPLCGPREPANGRLSGVPAGGAFQLPGLARDAAGRRSQPHGQRVSATGGRLRHRVVAAAQAGTAVEPDGHVVRLGQGCRQCRQAACHFGRAGGSLHRIPGRPVRLRCPGEGWSPLRGLLAA